MNSANLGQRRPLFSIVRTIVVTGILIGLFVSFLGQPALRVSYTYRGHGEHKTILSASYWTITGPLSPSSRYHLGDYPVLVLVPLETPLSVRLHSAFNAFLNPSQS